MPVTTRVIQDPLRVVQMRCCQLDAFRMLPTVRTVFFTSVGEQHLFRILHAVVGKKTRQPLEVSCRVSACHMASKC